MGQPATATVLIDSSAPAPAAPGNRANPNGNLRDAFNRADPAGDAMDFGAGFVSRLRAIHFELGGGNDSDTSGLVNDIRKLGEDGGPSSVNGGGFRFDHTSETAEPIAINR